MVEPLEVSSLEKSVLTHTLGYHRTPKIDRNFFVTGPDSIDDFKACQSLVEKGLMVDRGKPSFLGNDETVFVATKEGISLQEKIEQERIASLPKKTRSQRRYQAYLHSESDESFFEWLGNSYWDEYRKQQGVS